MLNFFDRIADFFTSVVKDPEFKRSVSHLVHSTADATARQIDERMGIERFNMDTARRLVEKGEDRRT